MRGKKYKGISGIVPETTNRLSMAGDLGISINTLNSYLYGFRRPKPETATRIVAYLRLRGCLVDLADIYQVALCDSIPLPLED